MDAQLSPDFDGFENSLVPIIFSHGLQAARYFHFGVGKELASHGYIVFLIDHSDGSCLFYTNEDGTGE